MGKNCSYSLKRKADSANQSSFSTRLALGRASLIAQLVKNPPAMQETWVQSLVWEDLLEECMATHSSILAWRIPMHRGAWQVSAHRVTRVGHP